MSVSDEEILDLFADPAQKERAFSLLVDAYSERLYYQIRRMVNDHDDTDDVLQNVFIKVWRYLDGFNRDAQLHTWLYRIAHNESVTFLKKQQRNSSESLDDAYMQPIADSFTDGDAIQQKLQQAIDTLPDKQKQVFLLRYYDELSYDEMSEVLGTSVGGLKASYHHAVKKIEAFLTGG